MKYVVNACRTLVKFRLPMCQVGRNLELEKSITQRLPKLSIKWGYRGPVAMEAYASGDPEEAIEAFRKAFTIADAR